MSKYITNFNYIQLSFQITITPSPAPTTLSKLPHSPSLTSFLSQLSLYPYSLFPQSFTSVPSLSLLSFPTLLLLQLSPHLLIPHLSLPLFLHSLPPSLPTFSFIHLSHYSLLTLPFSLSLSLFSHS